MAGTKSLIDSSERCGCDLPCCFLGGETNQFSEELVSFSGVSNAPAWYQLARFTANASDPISAQPGDEALSLKAFDHLAVVLSIDDVESLPNLLNAEHRVIRAKRHNLLFFPSEVEPLIKRQPPA